MKLYSCLEIYIQVKRNAGYEYSGVAKFLRQFARTLGNIPMRNVTKRHVSSVLDPTRIRNNTLRSRHGMLRGFFNYWFSRRHIRGIPLPPKRPIKRSNFSPYIYSRREVVALLDATVRCQRFRICAIEPHTLRTLLLLLYGTGMLVGEALRLNSTDVDLGRKIIHIRGAAATRTRSLPIGKDMCVSLKKHVDLRAQTCCGRDEHLFTTARGIPIPSSTLVATFQRLRRLANVKRLDGAVFQPRIHDFRHTFAVHSLEGWYRRGFAIDHMLPLLTIYMGNVRLTNMEKYLKLTPVKFARQLRKLAPTASQPVTAKNEKRGEERKRSRKQVPRPQYSVGMTTQNHLKKKDAGAATLAWPSRP